MKRRHVLKGAGLTAAAGLLGFATMAHRLENDPDATQPDEQPSLPATPRTPEPELADEYGRVVDVVEAGADPTGDSPINAILADEADDDTLLEFPAGTYRLEPGRLSGYSHLGLLGIGESRPTFVPPPGECIGDGPYFHFDDVAEFLFQGGDFDFRQNDSGGEIRVTATGNATVRDVTIGGSCPAQVANFRFDVVDEAGAGLVENYRSTNSQHDPWLTGVYVGQDHAGELTFRNSEVHGFSGNGIYASAPGLPEGAGGVVNVENGAYRNNNIANIRLGTVQSTARGAEVRVDTSPPEHVGVNARGIRLRNQQDQLVENCNIEFTAEAGSSFGAIVFHPANGGALVRDTQIRIEKDTVQGIRAFPPAEETTMAPEFENVTVTGGASLENAALIEARPNTEFRSCEIKQTGTDRGGIYLHESPGCRIVDCEIEVTGDPLVLRKSDVQIENTTFISPTGTEHIESQHADDGDFVPTRADA
jgi:hypothetical protein